MHQDHHIRFGKALYSVPHANLRKQVDVRGDRSLVRLYFQGELVKTHPTQPPGGRDTDHGDYPSEKTTYTMRDTNRMISEGRRHGSEVGRFLENLLAGTFSLGQASPDPETDANGSKVRRPAGERGLRPSLEL